MQDIAVELRRVSKSFGHQTVVREVSLRIQRGEFFSLLGPSGCGKTTLLRLIASFERPDGGEVLFHGVDSGGTPAYAREVNLVFQHYALFPHMTVAQNVAFGLEMGKVPRAERDPLVQEALELVRLTGFEGRYPRQLSGGQQQRVALARAIVTRPPVLLLDEPLGALDLKLRKEMQIELKTLQRRLGMTFLYVTHDQEEALVLSDRIAVMNHGRVHQVGTPEEIYNHPATHFVACFIGETNFLQGRVSELTSPYAVVRVDETPIKVPCGDGCVPGAEVILAIRPERIALDRLLKKASRDAAQGENRQDKIAGSDFEQRSWPRGRRAGCPESSGVDMAVNEHFEPVFNAAMRTSGLFQQPVNQEASSPVGNCFPAWIEDRRYLGSDTLYTVRAGEHLYLTVRETNQHHGTYTKHSHE